MLLDFSDPCVGVCVLGVQRAALCGVQPVVHHFLGVLTVLGFELPDEVLCRRPGVRNFELRHRYLLVLSTIRATMFPTSITAAPAPTTLASLITPPSVDTRAARMPAVARTCAPVTRCLVGRKCGRGSTGSGRRGSRSPPGWRSPSVPGVSRR